MKVCGACTHRFQADGWQCPHCAWSPRELHGFLAFSPETAEANDGFAADYFPALAELESGNFWFESRNRLIIWAMHRFFPQARDFFEIGCGTGFVLRGLQQECPTLNVSASEIFTRGLEYAQARVPIASLFQMDARSIPFDAEFDVVGAFDVLEHIEEDSLVLSEMFRATRRGGGIILAVPQHRFLWSAADDTAMHKRRYVRKELLGKVRSAGFQPVFATSYVSLLLPLMLVSRLRRRKGKPGGGEGVELRLPRLANVLLTHVLTAERAVIQRGVSLPTGGSLLLVAARP